MAASKPTTTNGIATTQHLDQIIDALLERYLHLVDDYSRLREDLSKLQSSMYQHLARANFGAERGVWYGQDYYDERTQATSTVSVSINEAGREDLTWPRFGIVRQTKGTVEQHKQEESQTETRSSEEAEKHEGKSTPSPVAESRAKKENEKQPPAPVDPIRWFGLMAPMSLRQAQAQSIRAVDEIVPRLATVAAEMVQVEIEVRRARKKRAKALSAATKRTAAGSNNSAESAIIS